jgi:hypothetical protein
VQGWYVRVVWWVEVTGVRGGVGRWLGGYWGGGGLVEHSKVCTQCDFGLLFWSKIVVIFNFD